MDQRVKVVVRGAVQGVGFRPCVYRLASSLELRGWVSNTAQGVFIEAEGPRSRLNQFLLRLEREKPPRAIVQSLECSFLEAAGYSQFEIHESDGGGEKRALILPDLAVCADCLREMFDTGDRRHLYPFTNCTNCGPRFTIIESLPYDRPNTSMRHFTMCADCEREYRDPANRRFHAQPNACPKCGPQLALWNESGAILADRHDALLQAADAVREGRVIAFKGVGGFQLMVDARNEKAVRRLRSRKRRAEKPFAVMYPALEMSRGDCHVSDFEARLVASPETPIVLLRRHARAERIAPSVAPNNPHLGAMLPCSPLHHLLMRELGFPVVATSGNVSDEPICIDEHEALDRLRGVADLLLVHDRPIVRPVDDSVARVILDREMILRRARGYAPLPIHLNQELPAALAVGSHLKNTVAAGIGHEIFVSQHIGDLETSEAFHTFRRTAADLPSLYDFEPAIIACDAHPEYMSTKYARGLGRPVMPVQHHYAHVLACMAENELEPPVLGVSWDGTGLGLDGTIWGGEFLLVDETSFERFAHLRAFRLPGGDAAAREPRRCALGLLWEIFGEALFDCDDVSSWRRQFSDRELKPLRQMLAKGINAPKTSSAGRLFDAVASMLGIRQRSNFEGQAAMELEFATRAGIEDALSFFLIDGTPAVLDWEPLIREALIRFRRGEPVWRLTALFQNTLVEMIAAVAAQAGARQVVLTGGCFQNKYLVERTVGRLRREGFQPFWHQRIPPNDGGIAVGQILAAARARKPVTAEICYA